MAYLNKLGFVWINIDGLSRLIPKHCKSLEDMAITALRSEGEIKNNIMSYGNYR